MSTARTHDVGHAHGGATAGRRGEGRRSGRRGPDLHTRRLRVLGTAAVLGVGTGVLTQLLAGRAGAAVLLGLLVALGITGGWALWKIATVGPEDMKEHFRDLDPSRRQVEALSLAGAAGALVGVGVLMVVAPGDTLLAGLGLAVVFASWLTLHSTFTFSYAKHFMLVEPGCIDLDRSAEDEEARRLPPALMDFAYPAFSVGMTYQISDTTLKTTGMRRLVFWHSLLSYVFGTVVMASSINLVATILTQ